MNIGLLGCGVVGGGILDFCAERADLTVAKVLVRRPRPELGALAVTDICSHRKTKKSKLFPAV